MDPRISVVVVCLNPADRLGRCLAALAPQAGPEVEIIAVGHWDETPLVRDLRGEFYDVEWISVANTVTVPRMRAAGLARTRGDIVALIEDDCVVGHDWCQAVIRAHAEPLDAIGGAIAPAPHYSCLDWAVYWCEYGRFSPPLAGRVSALPGNNVSYKREVIPVDVEGGFQEVFFHWRLQREGSVLWAEPDLVVANVNSWSVRHVTTTPYHHGRAFAATRVATLSVGRRSAYGIMTTALPLVKVGRLAGEVLRRRRYLRHFATSLPWCWVFACSWAFGEFVGCWFGAGDSASRWV